MGERQELLVTPEYLRDRADELQERFHEAEKNCQRLISLSAETKPFLLGKSGEILRKRLLERQKELEIKIDILEKTFVQLYELADEYEQAERENVNGAVQNRSVV